MLDILEQQILICNKCPEAVRVRLYPMSHFHGNDIKIMIIGMNPGPPQTGEQESLKKMNYDYKEHYAYGIQHCQMGEFVSKLLNNIGLTWDNLFFTNVIKCATPGAREPSEVEFNNCKHYLEQQIELINPKRYVLLGNFVSQHCGYNNKEIPFVDVLRQDKIFVIHHPTYLRRTGKEFLEINFVRENWNAA